MDLNERIKNIGVYFKFMNITPEVYYILASFPKKWVVPANTNENVKIMKHDDDEFYFYTELENGYDVLFDVIDEIIRQNREIEEKYKLFNSKLNELKKIFENEDLVTLENMKFTVDAMEPLTFSTKGTTVTESEDGEQGKNDDEGANDEQQENEVQEVIDEKPREKKKKNGVGPSIMEAAKKLVES
jgi:hypothetical protein